MSRHLPTVAQPTGDPVTGEDMDEVAIIGGTNVRSHCCHRGLLSLPPLTATFVDGVAAAVTVHHRGWLRPDF